MQEQGFETVEYRKVDSDTIIEAVDAFERKVENYDIPSDGLVLLLDDIAYGQSLGTTAKFPRDSIAFTSLFNCLTEPLHRFLGFL